MEYYFDRKELYGKSDYQIAVELGQRFKEMRIALHLTQADVAEQSGVSVMTLVRFENGKGHTIGLVNLIALMRAIQQLERVAGLVPELPESLYDKPKDSPKRVRKSKNEE